MNDDTARRLQITTESINIGHTLVAGAATDEEINMLRRQLAAAKIVIAGLDRQAIAQGRERAALCAQAADVAGERAANAVLTAEIDRLTKYAAHCDSLIAAYKDVTARGNSLVMPHVLCLAGPVERMVRPHF